jgi:hypothetical protein
VIVTGRGGWIGMDELFDRLGNFVGKNSRGCLGFELP